jgi:hypothetical protein
MLAKLRRKLSPVPLLAEAMKRQAAEKLAAIMLERPKSVTADHVRIGMALSLAMNAIAANRKATGADFGKALAIAFGVCDLPKGLREKVLGSGPELGLEMAWCFIETLTLLERERRAIK